MRIPVFAHNDPQRLVTRKSRSFIIELCRTHQARTLDGKGPVDTERVQLTGYHPRLSIGTEKMNPLPGMGRIAVNRGSAGQNVANYPIPYCFEGHLTQPRAAQVNFVPKVKA